MAVSALGRMRGEWRSAVELLRSCETKYGVKPNDYTYNAAITACGKARQWKLALELLEGRIGSGRQSAAGEIDSPSTTSILVPK